MDAATAAAPGGRYLFYTNECVGLGHLRRALALARAVTEDPPATALIVTGSPTPPDSHLPPRVDLVALPRLARDGDGRHHAARLELPPDDVHRLRASIAVGAADTFAPDVAVVDKTPFGLGGELRPAVESLRSRSCRLVLGLRDVEDAPERVRSTWGAPGLRREVERLYDALLVFGPRSEHDALACIGWEDVALPVHHVGYVGRDAARGRPADLPDDFLLATVGGGADGFPLLATLVEALRDRPLGLPVLLVTGPLMPAAQVDALRRAAAGLAVDVQDYRPDMDQVVGAARAVVGMAGYNTVGELLRAGTPALLVPRTRPSAEQLIRARDLEARGRVDVLTPEEADPRSLRAALDRLLACPRSAPHGEWDGASRTAAVLRELAADRRSAAAMQLSATA